MPRFLVAIDNGSQSTKVSIVDERGTVHASGRSPLRPYASSGPGVSEHPDDDVWDSIARASHAAMAAFAGDPRELVGVGLCTIRFCRALLDEQGMLVQPLMSWMDARVSAPYEHTDDRVRLVTTSSGYIAGRLTGTVTDFAGNVQGRWPVDTRSWRWSDDETRIDAEGIPRSMLPPLALPGETLGTITSRASQATGIPAGLPVVATSNDKAVEALGCGLLEPGEALLSLGTYIAAMTPAASGHLDTQRPAVGWPNFASIPHRTLLESDGIRRGMWTVSWYRDLVFGADSASAAASGTLERELEEAAAHVPAGANGVSVVLDWLAPTDDPSLRGAILGFDGSQGRSHVYRAILEAIALTMHEHVERLLDGAPSSLVVSGGGSSSELMMRIIAGVFNVEVRRTEMSDAAGLGAAICAAVGLGVHESWEDAVAAMVRTARSWQPEPELVAAYAEIAPRSRRLRAATRQLHRDLEDAID